ncbi:MAG: glucuronate isomerase, partial [Agathobacter sp.]|nr:glucuronate isomerase [Agathobacter sp.]
ANGCTISDHSLDYVMYAPASMDTIEGFMANRMAGELLTKEEVKQFETAFMIAMGREYHKRNWVMQLHYGVKRDNNHSIFRKLGPDAGIDAISNYTPSAELADFLNALADTDQLPKTILYSLNPMDNAAIGTILGCFQDSSCIGKIQQGSAWWFNDNKQGMIDQMTSLANLGLLGNFIGMLTDSRSFLSYTRHEYFRRIACDLIGGWVENGEYPMHEPSLSNIIRGLAYNNAVAYFGFNLEQK